MKNTTRLYRATIFFFLLPFLFSFTALPPETGGSITGRVLTADGQPAIAVTVQIKGSTRSTVTAENGAFALHRLPAGHYTLEVSLVGYEPTSLEIDVETGKTTTVSLQLQLSQRQLEQITVTGSRYRLTRAGSNDLAKMPLNNLENPQSYSTVTSTLMTEQGVYDLDDALKNVPGANKLWAATDRSGFGNGSSFVLRGFQLNTYLRNGIPANVSTTIDNANVESIEVLKGPSATLFGSAVTSYGGLINRVTKKPYDYTGGEIAYSGGSYGFNRLTADVNMPLDSAKTLLFRVNTALNTQNSWQDAGFHKNIFVAPSLTYKANERLSFSFDAELYQSQGTTPQLFFFDATVAQLGVNSADKLNLDYNRSYISNDLVLHSSNRNFTGQINYKLSANWTSRTNMTIVNTSSNGPMPYFYLLPGNDQISRNVWTIDGTDQTLDVQENIVGQFKTGPIKHRLLLGADYYNYNANVRYHEFMGTADGQTAADLFDVINTTGNIPNYLNFNKAKVDSVYANSPADPYPYIISTKEYISSAYASDVIDITDRLIANAALRIDHFDFAGNYNPVDGSTTGGYHQTALSPKFGLVYQILKNNLSLFGNYQNGFTNETGTDYAGHAFKPEEANQLEGGVKLNAYGGKLSGTISYYDIRVKNVLREDIDHPNFSVQSGTQLSKGLEVELIASPFEGMNIIAGYAYNDSKYTNADSDVNGLRPNSSGPQNMANLWLSYRFLQGGVKGLGFGFGGNYAGKSLVESGRSEGQFYVPEYTLMNATVFYDAGRFRLSANVNNIANRKYWIGWYTVNPQQPRSINGSIAFRF